MGLKKIERSGHAIKERSDLRVIERFQVIFRWIVCDLARVNGVFDCITLPGMKCSIARCFVIIAGTGVSGFENGKLDAIDYHGRGCGYGSARRIRREAFRNGSLGMAASYGEFGVSKICLGLERGRNGERKEYSLQAVLVRWHANP